MSATITNFPSTQRLLLECSKCGKTTTAAEGCTCNVAYVPAAARAAAAIEENPEKSDRAIAAEIGVGKDTVRRSRKSTGANAPVGKRVGKDGKARTLPKRSAQPTPINILVTEKPNGPETTNLRIVPPPSPEPELPPPGERPNCFEVELADSLARWVRRNIPRNPHRLRFMRDLLHRTIDDVFGEFDEKSLARDLGFEIDAATGQWK